MSRWLPFCALLAAILFPSAGSATSVVLITAEEAGLAPSQQVASARGILRAPRIEVLEEPGPLHSPVHFKLTFRAFGGVSIDPGSVSVTYLKSADIDLTPRVRPFVSAAGIDIPQAEVPPGNHLIRVTVKDLDGHQGVTEFTLSVKPSE